MGVTSSFDEPISSSSDTAEAQEPSESPCQPIEPEVPASDLGTARS